MLACRLPVGRGHARSRPGGAQHYAVVRVHKGSAMRNADTFGVLQITLGAGTYQWRFVHVVGATFTDTGTGTCH